MTATHVLIVEPDVGFALSLASLFQDDGRPTAVARSAAEAEREVAARPPGLVLVRAELPDASGFSLCARLRRLPSAAGVPVLVLSSEAGPEAFAEHARTPGGADAYLAMPVDTSALLETARRLLAAGPAEPADDAVLEEGDVSAVEVALGRPAPAQAESVPPPVPQRHARQALDDEDRAFLQRAFRSVADHRPALVAESYRRRPPPRRDLLTSPEGRAALLRDELKEREAQVARLAELWEVREREVASAGERLHRKDVELQGMKLQAEELARKLAATREIVLQREREHGASIQDLLLDKFGQEKELIEVVAAGERRIHELQREARLREDELAKRGLALDAARDDVARLERELGEARDALEAAAREREDLRAAARGAAEAFQARVDEREAALADRERRLAAAVEERRRAEEEGRGLGEDLAREREARSREADAARAEAAALRAEAATLRAEVEAARAEADRRRAEADAARAESAARRAEADAARGDAAARCAEADAARAVAATLHAEAVSLRAEVDALRGEVARLRPPPEPLAGGG
jgi:ParB family chromosome partitioning protein